MVIPNFFITFVRHSFHTSHPLHAPLSRETASPCTTLPPGTTLPSCTRAASRIKRTRLPHTLHLARLCHTRHTHAMHPRPHSTHALRATTPRKELCHTRHTHATHPRPHSTLALRATTPHKGYATRATHTLCILALTAHSPSTLSPLARAMPCRATTKHESHAPPRTHAPASFLRRKREPHNNQNITYYNITCNVYPNRSKDYTKKRGNLFLYRLNLLSLHDES